MKNILVGIDFQKESELLLENVKKVAKQFNSKIWLLHVAAPDPDFVGFSVGPQYIRDSRAKELKDEHKKLAKYVSDLESENFEAEGLLIAGPTIETLLLEAEKLKVDIIMIGNHEHGFIYNSLFGDNSIEIAIQSNIPVLIIPQ